MTDHYNILAPGPSIQNLHVMRMRPGFCVAVNDAYLFADFYGFLDAIDILCVRDEHYFWGAIENMIGSCTDRLIEIPIVWTYIKYRPQIQEHYPDLITSYFSSNMYHFIRSIPYPSRRLWSSTTLSSAIGHAISRGAKTIDLYGVDMQGYGYGHEVNYDRQWKKPRWKYERAELALQIKEAKQNGVRIRRRFHEKQECAV